MKSFRIALIAFVSSLVLPAVAQYPIAWSAFREVGLKGSEEAIKSIAAPGGGFYLYGTVANSSQSLVRLTASGQVQWTRIIPGAAGDAATGVGGTVIAGKGAGNPLIVAKYDPSGTLLWTRNLSGADNIRTAIDAAGNAIVASGASVVKLAAGTGATIWTSNTASSVRGLAVDSLGEVFAAGTATPNGIPSTVIVKLDPTGPQLWSKTQPGTSPHVLVDSSGFSYLVQGVLVTGVPNVQVTKLDGDGLVQWSTSTPASDPVAATMSKAGAILTVSGASPGLTVSRFTSAGVLSWSKSNTLFTPDGIGIGEIVTDPSENAYISATTVAAPQDAALVRFDPAGTFRWARTEAGSTNIDDEGRSAVVDPLGHVMFLSRVVNVGTATDLRASSYDPAGNRLWGSDVDLSRGDDKALGAVTDSAGNTYVLGSTVTSDSSATPTFSITKFNANATVVWSHGIGAVNGPLSEMLPPQLAPGGGVVLVQRAHNGQGMRGTIYRYDPNGVLLWTYASFPGNQFLSDFRIAADGSVVLVLSNGTSDGLGGLNVTTRVSKISSAGALLGSTDIAGDVADSPGRINIDSGGNIYVTYSRKVATMFEAALAKFDVNGTYLWASAVGAQQAAPTFSFGDIVFDSSASPCFGVLGTLYKFNPSGSFVWSRTGAGSRHIVIDSLNEIFGMTTTQVYRVLSDSSKQWVATLPYTAQPTGYEFFPDNKGGVTVGFTAVNSSNPKGDDYQIAQFNAVGVLVWDANSPPFSQGIFPIDAAGLNNDSVAFTTDSAGDMFAIGTGFGTSGTRDINVVKLIAADSISNQSSGYTISMVAGQTYQLYSSFVNAGIQTWSNAAGYRLIVLDPNPWGVANGFMATTVSVPTGKVASIPANLIAPSTPGTYTFQAKMYRNGVGSFGAVSPLVTANVAVAPDAARMVSCDCPTVDFEGNVTVHVDMLNVGTTTWTAAGGYFLTNPTGTESSFYNPHQLDPTDSIAPGAHKVFTFQIGSTLQQHQVGFQMCHSSTRFGDAFRTIVN